MLAKHVQMGNCSETKMKHRVSNTNYKADRETNYLNLSGPIEKKSSLIVGRRRRVAALMLATKTMSSIRPMSKFICV